MKINSDSGEPKKLRATVSIVTTIGIYYIAEVSDPLLLQGTDLPVEATYEFKNATEERRSSREVHLFFGENKLTKKNISLGQYIIESVPLAPKGPSYIKIKVSVSTNQELCMAVMDPATMGYRSVGFVDLSEIEPPEFIPPPSRPIIFDSKRMIAEMVDLMEEGHHMPLQGRDISHNLTISFDEALYGMQKHIELLRSETCHTCDGSGAQPGTAPVRCDNCQGTGLQKKPTQSDQGTFVNIQTCPTCNGTSQIILSPCITCQGQTWVKNKRPFTVNIPSGIDSGTQICFPNQGEPGQYGGQSGHLYIIITVAKHPLFTRIGYDISIHLPVSVNIAKEGGQLQVPSVEKGSFFILNLPPNTRHGTIFQVSRNESYTLNATIYIYHPYNPIARLKIQKRLRAIKEALDYGDFEIRV